MSLTYARLKPHPKKLLAFTGLTASEFEALLVPFSALLQAAATLTRQGQPRQRRPGGGRKATLAGAADKLLFILFYLKTYPLQEVMGELFDLDVSNVNTWIHRLLPVVQAALARLDLLPERDAAQLAQAPVPTSAAPTLIIDGTERRRQRPSTEPEQTLHYSGKKKAHTDKNVVIVEAETHRVQYLSQTYPGIAHDKKIADHEQINYPPNTQLYQDTGFQGYQPAGVDIQQPQKNRAAKSFPLRPNKPIGPSRRCALR